MPWDQFWTFVIQALIVFILLIILAGGVLEVLKAYRHDKKED